MDAKKAVIYVRVSTDRQAERGVSLDNQERACNEWALRNGVLALKLFREEGVSAKTLKRPAMQEMIEYINENSSEIDYIVVYQVDRLSRNVPDFVDFGRFLYSHKIELRDSTSHLESSESDELIQTLHAAVAQHENKKQSRRVTDNMKRHAQQGFRMHQPPLGLRAVRNGAGRPTVEPIQPIADNIAYLLTEFAKGIFTKGQLLHEARRIGLVQKNGAAMSYQYLDKMLKQPLYAGLIRSSFTNGEYVPSVYTGLIPEWVYYANQQLLEGRVRARTDGYQNNHPDYPLRKFVVCAGCDSLLRGSASTGRGGKRYPRYHCTTSNCKSIHVKPEELHRQFVELLGGLKPDESRLKLIKTVILRVWRDEMSSMRTRRSKLREQLDVLAEQKLDAAEKVVTGELTGPEKVAISNRLSNKIGSLQSELSQLDSRIGTKEEAIEYAVEYIGNAPYLWLNASPDMRQIYQRMIFPEGISYNMQTGDFGTAKMSALYTFVEKLNSADLLDKSSMVIPRGIEPRLPG